MKFQSTILLGFSIATVGTIVMLGAATPAVARDIKAGPIWNNEDAKVKCPVAAAAVGGIWNGQWRTTVWGKESVCSVDTKPSSEASARDIKAGPIWDNEDAKVKCPIAAAAVGGIWNGEWRTTVRGKESVCGVVTKPSSDKVTVDDLAVNGRNVMAVRFAKGEYLALGNGNWKETNVQGKTTFSFKEAGRDDWSVYLLDSSRNVTIQLDLHRKMVIYSDNTQKFDLYPIIGSKSR